jgi:hypothetical protein
MTESLWLEITNHCEFNNQQIPVHQRLWGKAVVYDQLGGKANVCDRLGGRVNDKSGNRNQLDELADSMVRDEDIMCRAPNDDAPWN